MRRGFRHRRGRRWVFSRPARIQRRGPKSTNGSAIRGAQPSPSTEARHREHVSAHEMPALRNDYSVLAC
jgi:hypothetical protein